MMIQCVSTVIYGLEVSILNRGFKSSHIVIWKIFIIEFSLVILIPIFMFSPLK